MYADIVDLEITSPGLPVNPIFEEMLGHCNMHDPDFNGRESVYAHIVIGELERMKQAARQVSKSMGVKFHITVDHPFREKYRLYLYEGKGQEVNAVITFPEPKEWKRTGEEEQGDADG